MYNFEVHSNESACIKSDRLGMDQVYSCFKGNVLTITSLQICLLDPYVRPSVQHNFI